MEKVSGLVLEVREQECLILAPGNRYVRIKLPVKPPLVGEIAEGYPIDALHSIARLPVSRVWAYVASILITVIFSGYQVYAVTSAPAAYVSLDMGSSVELVLNSRGKVIKTRGYNDQGNDLLEKTPVTDLLVDEALKSLVHESAVQTNTHDNNVAILTYTASSNLNQKKMNDLMVTALSQEQFKGQLLVDAVDSELHDKATDADVSPGQQLVVDLAAGENIPLDREEFKGKNLSSVLNKHGIKLQTLVNRLPSNDPIVSELNFSSF